MVGLETDLKCKPLSKNEKNYLIGIVYLCL